MKSYYVTKIKHKGSIWRIPEKLLEKFGLSAGSTVTLNYGTLTAEVKVFGMTSKKGTIPPTISFSSAAIKKLCIIEGSSLLVNREDDREFRLGPVIGILTFSKNLPKRVPYYTLYARRNGKRGLVYVFCGRDLDKEKPTVNGYYFDCWKNVWKSGEFPYPDVVINRCYPNPVRTCEFLEERIGKNKIFNKKTLINKLDFYQSLKDIEELKEYIPKTKLLSEKKDLIEFLLKNEEVFLKPVDGMMGRGIVKISRQGIGSALDCIYLNKEKKFIQQTCHINKIPKILMDAAGRKRRYIVQQAIQRMNYQEGPFSFRTWAMKNGNGKWVVPGMFAKASYGDSFLTNFTAGAKLVSVNKLIEYLLSRLPYTKEHFNNLLENLTIKTAEALDEKYGPLGELGLDIVFDLQGKPWIIEANGNPGNIPIFIQNEYPLWKDLVFRYPMEYAAYLAGFGQKNTYKK